MPADEQPEPEPDAATAEPLEPEAAGDEQLEPEADEQPEPEPAAAAAEQLAAEPVAHTLQTTCNDWSRSDGFNMIAGGPLEPEAAAYNIQTNDGGQHRRKDRPAGGMYVSETDTALTVGGTDSTRIVETPPDSFWDGGPRAFDKQSNSSYGAGEVSHTLSGRDFKSATDIVAESKKQPTVRRLTPLECTRLMGYPDEWLDGIEGGSDAKKYRALGNSLAVPCVEWIFERLADFHREHAGPGGNK